MSTSIETQWQSQRERRRRLFRITLMITDTAFYRNHGYHSANDTAEKLDYRRMAMVVVGVYGAVIDLSSYQ